MKPNQSLVRKNFNFSLVWFFLILKFRILIFAHNAFCFAIFTIRAFFLIFCLFSVYGNDGTQQWKSGLEVGGVKLFTKLSATEAQCNICVNSATNGPKKIKLVNGNTKILVNFICLEQGGCLSDLVWTCRPLLVYSGQQRCFGTGLFCRLKHLWLPTF
jgi:hypothetical protein